MFNKRGQFYLMAAIVVILIIMGLAVVPNKLRKAGTDNSKIYELFAEVNIDSKKMIDYSPSSNTGYNDDKLKKILSTIKETYPQISKIYILIKRNTEINFYTYNKDGQGEIQKTEGDISLNTVNIGDVTYNFQTDDSNNFYYLIIQEKNKQQYVIKG